MVSSTPDSFLEVAVAAAQKAGGIHLERLGKSHEIAFKGEIDLVTEVDRLAEASILETLKAEFPDHAIVAEESGASLTGSEYCWYVDPLDGTTKYAHAFPFFAVSIGLARNGRMEVGVVYAAAFNELFTAVRGQGARLNGRPIHVSEVARLNDALLASGFPPSVRKELTNVPEFVAFLRRGQAVRRPGAASLDLAYQACGRLDGFWEFGLAPWDVAAGSLLIEEAGGKVSAIRGDAFSLTGREILTSNGRIHEEMRQLLLSPPRLQLDPLS